MCQLCLELWRIQAYLLERSRLEAQGWPPNVIATIQSARASSTRDFYSYKWCASEHWCQTRGLISFQWSMVDVLTLKVHLAAISACHIDIYEVSLGAHPSCYELYGGRVLPVAHY